MDFYESDQYDYEIFCSCNGSAADFLALPKWKTAFKRMAVRPPATMPLSVKMRRPAGSSANKFGTAVTPSPMPTEQAMISKFSCIAKSAYGQRQAGCQVHTRP